MQWMHLGMSLASWTVIRPPVMGTSIKRRRFGEQDPSSTNCCAVANPEGQADVGSDDSWRTIVTALHEGVEVGVLV